jgi:hypothetical protein
MDGLDAIQEIRNLIGKPGVSKEALGLLLDKADTQASKEGASYEQELENNKKHFEDIIENLEANVIKPENLLEEQLIDEFKLRLEQYRNGKMYINEILNNFKLL